MSTWARTDQTGAVHLFELDDAAIAKMFKTAKRVKRPVYKPEDVCDCCGWVQTPCLDCVTPDGCSVCTDPTCPCCASDYECLDAEIEG